MFDSSRRFGYGLNNNQFVVTDRVERHTYFLKSGEDAKKLCQLLNNYEKNKNIKVLR